MKKLFTVLFAISAFALAQGQVQFTEYFEDFADGDPLHTEKLVDSAADLPMDSWVLSHKNWNPTLPDMVPMIEAGALMYEDYVGSEMGNKVTMEYPATGASSDLISLRRVMEGTITDKLYVAFLVKVNGTLNSSFRDIINWETNSNGGNFSRGRALVSEAWNDGATEEDPSTPSGELTFAVAKNTNSADNVAKFEGIFALGETNLVVMEYAVVEGDDNDVIRLYVNPDMDETAENNTRAESTDTPSDYVDRSFIAISLRQNPNIDMEVSSIRVSTTWADLWEATATSIGDAPSADANIYYSSGNLVLNNSENGVLSVYSISGALQLNKNVNANASVALNLKQGIYIVKYTDNNGQVQTAKISVN